MQPHFPKKKFDGAKPHAPNNQLIPETPNRKTTLLIGVIPVDACITVVQDPGPCISCTVLCRRPPVTVEANVVECTTVGTVATRKSCKAAFICSAGVGAIPMACAIFFVCRSSCYIHFYFYKISISAPVYGCKITAYNCACSNIQVH